MAIIQQMSDWQLGEDQETLIELNMHKQIREDISKDHPELIYCLDEIEKLKTVGFNINYKITHHSTPTYQMGSHP